MSPGVSIAAAAAVVCWLVWQKAQTYRCAYCGELGGHSVECPWNLDREERH